MPRESGAGILPRAGVSETSGSRRARARRLSALADSVKTFVDRTLDIARGRYDM
jgi:hypothetical protein